jgi:hypothetical protein
MSWIEKRGGIRSAVKLCSQRERERERESSLKTNQIKWTLCRYLQFRASSILLLFFKTCTERGTAQRAEYMSLLTSCFLICNSLSPDVHQAFLRPHHFNRLCFPERRLVIENTNLLLQTSSCVRVLFLFWGETDMALARSKGHTFCTHSIAFFLSVKG